MELHARQYSFDFYEAANESNCVLESKLTVATVKRDFPKGWSALAPGEVKRIMAGEMKACGQLNSLYSTIFRWVKEQSPELGIDEMGFCLVSTDEIPRDGCSMRLEVVLEPQHCLPFGSEDIRAAVRSVQERFFSAVDATRKIYAELEDLLHKQQSSDEEHPIYIVGPSEKVSEIDDKVEVSSRHIADFIERSLRKHKLLKSSVICMDDTDIPVCPSDSLIEAMNEDPCRERHMQEAIDTYVWTAFVSPNDRVYMVVDGGSVGRRTPTTEIEVLRSCFDGKMRNDAKRVNVNHLHQYQGKVVNLGYFACKVRFTRPNSSPKHSIVAHLGQHRKLHQMRGSNRPIPNSSLDRLVRERNALF